MRGTSITERFIVILISILCLQIKFCINSNCCILWNAMKDIFSLWHNLQSKCATYSIFHYYPFQYHVSNVSMVTTITTEYLCMSKFTLSLRYCHSYMTIKVNDQHKNTKIVILTQYPWTAVICSWQQLPWQWSIIINKLFIIKVRYIRWNVHDCIIIWHWNCHLVIYTAITRQYISHYFEGNMEGFE